jgi:hypothetical protein
MAFSDLDQIGSLCERSALGFDGLLIFAFSQAAFYALASRRFYFSGFFHYGRLNVHLPLKLEAVVHWAPEVLLAAKIALGRLDRRMS